MNRKLKRLNVPSWFFFEMREGNIASYVKQHPVPATLAPAPGDGWWYDRDAKVSWIQVGDLLCEQPVEDFSYELQLLTARRLREQEMAAIEEMRRHNLPLSRDVLTLYDATRENEFLKKLRRGYRHMPLELEDK